MTDEQIEQMREMLKAGKRLAWDSGSRLREILLVKMRQEDGDPPEISGILENGEYVALYNVAPEDILRISQPFVSDDPSVTDSD